MFFPHKTSGKTLGFAGLAAGIVLVAGLGPIAAMATEAPGAVTTAHQEAKGDPCELAGTDPQVLRCTCHVGGGIEIPRWLQEPDQFQSHILLIPGQGGKTRLSIK